MNLLPLVDFLIAHGNALADSGDAFQRDRDGWYFQLRDPIDFDLLAAQVTLPPSITCSRAHNEILDTWTWVNIRGGGTSSAAT